MIRVLSILVGKIGRKNRKGSGPKVVQSTGRETVFVRQWLGRTTREGDDRRMPNRQVAVRGRRQAGAPFSHGADKGSQNPPGGILSRKPANSNDPMDSAIGRISRVSGPVDARVTAEHDPPWNFVPLYMGWLHRLPGRMVDTTRDPDI